MTQKIHIKDKIIRSLGKLVLRNKYQVISIKSKYSQIVVRRDTAEIAEDISQQQFKQMKSNLLYASFVNACLGLHDGLHPPVRIFSSEKSGFYSAHGVAKESGGWFFELMRKLNKGSPIVDMKNPYFKNAFSYVASLRNEPVQHKSEELCSFLDRIILVYAALILLK